VTRFIKKLLCSTLLVVTSGAFAAPQYLVIDNQTSVESNAFVAGVHGSSNPSKPHQVNMVPWFTVQIACYRHAVNRECPATIKMATNANPEELAQVHLNLDTGAVTVVSVNPNSHYKFKINGNANVTLME